MSMFTCRSCDEPYEIPDAELPFDFVHPYERCKEWTHEQLRERIEAHGEKDYPYEGPTYAGDRWKVATGLDFEIVHHECGYTSPAAPRSEAERCWRGRIVMRKNE